ncbi:translation initiation factor IF-2 [Candidatus Uhrbacteria bacterium RIFCSPHIGHO2_01_FULL_63_20]|uniref:Translation initiation factor IF-2 n=1 Tax=Candidatus Uhrbacteria bacterium RIFCSPHIGHO2_01_FULL_63_20 TaxID=1802385 RepID=A0A1F7TMP1_9BACT|nr:MAG: translation initiation factor IF-2 [Candidatus Uhrbacteria bacterium RIFCSPHIGHO2_01_FULL_63_20]
MEEQKAATEAREQRRATAESRPIQVPAVITVRDFASRLDVPVPRVMQELMRNGILAAINERIDFDTAAILAEDLGFKALPEEKTSATEDVAATDALQEAISTEKAENLVTRAPVIVIMGHVDHGKTKLLDTIRSTNVMGGEAGGITQHIGAYQVVRRDRALTFIDTPGHEAFTVMRSRGAKVADIAVLVVAADDGVQPQTKEAADIIQSAHLPFVVALNKVDKPDANPERVKKELSDIGLIPEEWGGKVTVVPVSAKAGTGIDALLDTLILVADIEKERVSANPSRRAIGTVIESHVDAGTGAVATVLVQTGTLRVGDVLGVRGLNFGRVRAMRDWKGDLVHEAPPSTPVEIIGWKAAPSVGDVMEVPSDPKTLEKVKSGETKATEQVAAIKAPVSENVDGKQMMNLVIRADVLGSLEAILGMLDTIRHESVGVKVVGKGLGNITEVDVVNAEGSKAMVLGFNVKPTATAEQISRDKDVPVRTYQVIYKLFEDVLKDLQLLLPSETVITEIGKMEVLANFRKTDDGWIVGGKVMGGKLLPKAKLRLKRGEEYVGEGELVALQLGKAEIKEAHGGQECGLKYKGRVKAEPGDLIEAYTEEKKTQQLVIEGISKR